MSLTEISTIKYLKIPEIVQRLLNARLNGIIVQTDERNFRFNIS